MFRKPTKTEKKILRSLEYLSSLNHFKYSMIGDFVARYLSEEEHKIAVEINKRFEPSYLPYLVIRVLQYHSENVFDALICRGKTFAESGCIWKGNASSNTFVDDYYNTKNGVFTFDGIRFFKILNIYEDAGSGLFRFAFQFLNTHSFSERNTAFMVMPFGIDILDNFYLKNIKAFLQNSDLKITVTRSDDYTGTDVVADTILEQIRKAEFIICDITNRNKNVFFEIGYAKGIKKDMVFLLEQNKPAEFFDVNHIRRIEYSYEREIEFRELLSGTLTTLRNNRG